MHAEAGTEEFTEDRGVGMVAGEVGEPVRILPAGDSRNHQFVELCGKVLE